MMDEAQQQAVFNDNPWPHLGTRFVPESKQTNKQTNKQQRGEKETEKDQLPQRFILNFGTSRSFTFDDLKFMTVWWGTGAVLGSVTFESNLLHYNINANKKSFATLQHYILRKVTCYSTLVLPKIKNPFAIPRTRSIIYMIHIYLNM